MGSDVLMLDEGRSYGYFWMSLFAPICDPKRDRSLRANVKEQTLVTYKPCRAARMDTSQHLSLNKITSLSCIRFPKMLEI